MKLSNLILFAFIIGLAVRFTPARNYFKIEWWYLLFLFLFWGFFKIIEIKRANKKRRQLVKEIHTGQY